MDFEETLKKLKQSLFHVLGNEFQEYRKETQKDIEDFINNSKEKLEKWTKLLSSRKITLEEYEWLVKNQKDLMALNELEKVGVSKIRLGHFKNKMVKAIVDIGKAVLLNQK